MTRRVKYHKPLKVLAETHGMSLSRLEHRLRTMSLETALAMPMRSKEITKKQLLVHQGKPLTATARALGISIRKLKRLSQEYQIPFEILNITKREQDLTFLWVALHSPTLNYKSMVRYANAITGYYRTLNTLKYRLECLGLTLKQTKANLSSVKAKVILLLRSE